MVHRPRANDGRRMEVSWHADEGIVIVSLWHGSICRATFRLPVDQAPPVVQTWPSVGDAVASGPHPAARIDRHRCSTWDVSG